MALNLDAACRTGATRLSAGGGMVATQEYALYRKELRRDAFLGQLPGGCLLGRPVRSEERVGPTWRLRCAIISAWRQRVAAEEGAIVGVGGDGPAALVTGGSRGVGAATAVTLAGLGYNVVVTSRNKAARAGGVSPWAAT